MPLNGQKYGKMQMLLLIENISKMFVFSMKRQWDFQFYLYHVKKMEAKYYILTTVKSEEKKNWKSMTFCKPIKTKIAGLNC